MKLKKLLYYFGTKIIFKPGFIRDFYKFRSLQKGSGESIKWDDIYPVFNENTKATGFDTHYIYHPAWAARVVKEINPALHIDISSTLHFSTQLSAFIPTAFYDYRPAYMNLDNLDSGSTDLTRMHFDDASISSLSCMHTIEHIGLGRYGDPIDPQGDGKAAAELKRVLKEGGHLLLVTPVGRPRIMFNAQRVYSYEQIIRLFDGLDLQEFSLIPDSALVTGMIRNADPELVAKQHYGCGCFWFRKK